MKLKIFTSSGVLQLLYLVTFCRGNKENKSVCLEISTNVSKHNYETLLETLQILLEERKSCRCLEERVMDLERELQITKTKLSIKEKNTTKSPIPRAATTTTIKTTTTTEVPTTTTTTAPVTTPERLPKDCSEIYSTGEKRDGIYIISPNDIVTFPVYCDLQNGGWIVIQRRKDGAENFDRVWEDYARGFGNLSADFWLGLRYVHLLTMEYSDISFELVITQSSRNASAVYRDFMIENERNFFRMYVGRKAVYNTEMSKFITRDNGFYCHNTMKFSTKDSDNDNSIGNCAKYVSGGGYWYGNCYCFGNFNANNITEMAISDDAGSHIQISKSVIKIRKMF